MSSSEIAELVLQINKYIGIPGILFYSIFLFSKRSDLRIVFYILLASFFADIAADLYVRYIYANSHLIGTIWVVMDYFLVSWLFLKLLPHRKKIILVFLLIFVVGGFISSIFFYDFLESNTFIVSYPSVAFTYLCIVAFYEILKEGPATKLLQYPVFWILTGIFLFNSIRLLKNLFMNYLVFDLQVSQNLYLYVWLFGISFNMIKNLLFLYAFILFKKGHPDYILQPKTVTS